MNEISKEVEKRVCNESDKAIVCEKLRVFEESLDRRELNCISEDLFPYEKKYMKLYPTFGRSTLQIRIFLLMPF